MDRAYGPALRRKRAYVLVNPHAGPGGAQKKWDHEVEPIFKAARMPMTVHTTTFSKEAIDLAINMDIDQFDIVVPCSGDGLPYEVFNGLGKRPDARRALQKIAVAHVPCGSGNGLACNVFGTHRASLAALAIVKGVSTPIDLISITQGDNRSLSFLSQTVGIMAEADLGTEHLRWMGEHRFSYGVVTRILKKKAYPCDLYVKMEIDHKEGVLEHYRRERENSSVGELDKMTTSTGTPVGHDSVAGSETEVAKNEDGLPPLKFGTVRDKVPEGWKKIDADHMGNFFCGNVSLIHTLNIPCAHARVFLSFKKKKKLSQFWILTVILIQTRSPTWPPMSSSSTPPASVTASWILSWWMLMSPCPRCRDSCCP